MIDFNVEYALSLNIVKQTDKQYYVMNKCNVSLYIP